MPSEFGLSRSYGHSMYQWRQSSRSNIAKMTQAICSKLIYQYSRSIQSVNHRLRAARKAQVELHEKNNTCPCLPKIYL
eukprot:scaffold399070_cov36-Prasinocladus_malaysianus.AAC.1